MGSTKHIVLCRTTAVLYCLTKSIPCSGFGQVHGERHKLLTNSGHASLHAGPHMESLSLYYSISVRYSGRPFTNSQKEILIVRCYIRAPNQKISREIMNQAHNPQAARTLEATWTQVLWYRTSNKKTTNKKRQAETYRKKYIGEPLY